MADKLISFSELVKAFNTHCGGDCEFCDHHLRVHGKSKTRCLILNSLRAVDAVEVVHGRWIDRCYGYSNCSVCGLEHPERDEHNYLVANVFCPNCGAKMTATDNNVGHKDGGDS